MGHGIRSSINSSVAPSHLVAPRGAGALVDGQTVLHLQHLPLDDQPLSELLQVHELELVRCLQHLQQPCDTLVRRPQRLRLRAATTPVADSRGGGLAA